MYGAVCLFCVYVTLHREDIRHRLRVIWNRVLRRIYLPKMEEVTGDWRRLTARSFITCTLHHILFG